MSAARSETGVHSNSPPRRRGLFVLVGLAPMLLLYGTLLIGALLSVMLSLGSATPGSDGLFGLLMLLLGLVLAPALVILVFVRLLSRARNWLQRGLLLYLALDLLSVGLLFALLLGLGGASMAAVEGAVSMRGLTAGATLETAVGLLLAQLLIVPWTVVVSYLFHRVSAEGDSRKARH